MKTYTMNGLYQLLLCIVFYACSIKLMMIWRALLGLGLLSLSLLASQAGKQATVLEYNNTGNIIPTHHDMHALL